MQEDETIFLSPVATVLERVRTKLYFFQPNALFLNDIPFTRASRSKNDELK